MGPVQRGMLIVIALAVTGISVIAMIGGDQAPGWPVIFRPGVLLAAVWLAWPQLSRLSIRKSAFFLLAIAATGLVAATRPRLLPVVLGICCAALIVHWLLRWISQFLKGADGQAGAARRRG